MIVLRYSRLSSIVTNLPTHLFQGAARTSLEADGASAYNTIGLSSWRMQSSKCGFNHVSIRRLGSSYTLCSRESCCKTQLTLRDALRFILKMDFRLIIITVPGTVVLPTCTTIIENKVKLQTYYV